MSMKNPSKKFVKKANEMGKSLQENLSKIFSVALVGVGFVLPMSLGRCAQAADIGKGDPASQNTITISESEYTLGGVGGKTGSGTIVDGDSIYGGYSETGMSSSASPVEHNEVIINNSSVSLAAIFGGWSGLAAKYNKVSINGGIFVGTISAGAVDGGESDDEEDYVNYNEVNITAGTFNSYVCGGSATGENIEHTEIAYNEVTIESGAFNEDVYGGYIDGVGIVSSNNVSISDGTFNKVVYGGYVKEGWGKASSNVVNISGGTFNGDIYGGKASGETSSNVVSISDGIFKGKIYGGYDSGSGSGAFYNTVSIVGGTFVSSDIYGGYASNADSSNNTLKIGGKNISVNSVNNFQNYTFNIPAGMEASDAMLNITGTGNSITIDSNNTLTINPGVMTVGGTITLIDADAEITFTLSSWNCGQEGNSYDTTVKVDDNDSTKLIFTLNGITNYTNVIPGATSGNTVVVSSANSATVNGEEVTYIVDSTPADGPWKSIYGGFSQDDGALVTNNTVTFQDGAKFVGTNNINTGLLGGSSYNGSATYNKLYVTGGTLDGTGNTYYIVGGYGKIGANYNEVHIGSNFQQTKTNSKLYIYGGYSNDDSDTDNTDVANYNILEITGGTFANVQRVIAGEGYGGADHNTLTITGGSMTGLQYVVAGYSDQGDASNNTLSISGDYVGTVAGYDGVSVAGGMAFGSGGSADNNTVTISSGTYSAAVAGGYVHGNSGISASNNTVTIQGGSFSDEVAGGYVKSSTASTNGNGNTLTINDGVFEKTVYAVRVQGGTTNDNTLNINGGTFKSSVYAYSGSTCNNNVLNLAGGTITGYGITANTINISGTGAVLAYTGGTATVQSDGAVNLEGTLTLGAGATKSNVKIKNGVSVGANKIGSLVGGSTGNISTLCTQWYLPDRSSYDFYLSGTLNISNLVVTNCYTKVSGAASITLDDTAEWHFSGISYDSGEGKTLSVANNGGLMEVKSAKDVTITSLTGSDGAESYVFTLPSGIADGNTVLTITNSGFALNSGDSITVSGSVTLADGQYITLIASEDVLSLKDVSVTPPSENLRISLSEDGTDVVLCTPRYDLIPAAITDNTVEVTSATTGTVTNNSQTTAQICTEAAWRNAYGGYSTEADAVVKGNTITISGTAQLTGDVYGGYSENGVAGGTGTTDPGNTVIVTGADTGNIKAIYGGYAKKSGSEVDGASYNEVTIESSYTGTVSGNVYGGYNYSDESEGCYVQGNVVKIESGNFNESIYGGYQDCAFDGNVNGNKVKILGGMVLGNVYGGYVKGGYSSYAIGNTIEIEDGTVNGSLYGGYGGGGNSAESNTINIKGGTVKGNVYGGYGGNDNAYADSNTIAITSGTVEGNVYGGYSECGSATGNTVSIVSGTVNGSVYGGYEARGYCLEGNTLVIGGKNISISSVNNFQNYTFTLPADVESGDTMLKLTGDTALAFNSTDVFTVNVTNVVGTLQIADVITLIDATTAMTGFGNVTTKKIMNGENNWTEAKITATDDNKKIQLIVTGIKYVDVIPAATTGNEVTLTSGKEATIKNGDTTTTVKYNDGEGTATSQDGPWANVYGGYSTETGAVVKGNSVTVSEAGNLTGDIYGGYSKSGVAGGTSTTDPGNTVTVAGAEMGNITAIYGGYGADGAHYNTVTVDSSYTGTVAGETISYGTQASVVGGYADGGSTVHNATYNKVSLAGGTYTQTVYGGWTVQSTSVADGNEVEISGNAKVGNVVAGGAYGDRKNNKVTILGGTVTGNIYGGTDANGYSGGSTYNNSVVISAGKVDPGSEIYIYGGYSSYGNVVSDKNSVEISGTAVVGNDTYKINIYGGCSNYGSAGTTDADGGNTVTINGGTIINGYVLKGAYGYETASNNELLITAGVIAGISDGMYLYGGDSYGETLSNELNIKCGTISKVGALRGGRSINNTASSNKLLISGGLITGIDGGMCLYGGESYYGSVTENSVEISGGTLTNVKYIEGGEGKDVTSNKISITGGSISSVTGGSMKFWGGYGYGDANSNSVEISGGELSGVSLIEGAYGSNSADNNKILISAGVITGISSGMGLYGGDSYYSSSGMTADGNVIEISGGTLTNVKLTEGAYAYNDATNNKVLIQGGVIGGVHLYNETYGYYGANFYGAYSYNGDVTGNSLTINGGTITNGYELKGADGNETASNNELLITAGVITGIDEGMTLHAGSSNGSATENSVEISGGTLTNAYYIQGAYCNASANSNEVKIIAGEITGINGGMCINGASTGGSGENNKVSITGGTLSNIMSITGVWATTGATGNSVIISSPDMGEVFGETGTGYEIGLAVVGGLAQSSGDANGNSVTISTGTYDMAIYGGYAVAGNAGTKVMVESVETEKGNTVTINGGSYKADIYGGYVNSGSGVAKYNVVNIEGGVVDGSVYGGAAPTAENVTDNTLNWSGGTIKGSTIKANTINISGTGATYLGTSGTMTADSAVTLGNGTDTVTFTVGNGTATSALTLASGLDAKANSTLDILTGSSVTLQGTSTLAGAVSGEGSLKNTGTLTAGAANLGEHFINDTGATLKLQGDLTKSIAGAGTTVLQNAITVTEDRNVEGILNVNSNTIDMQDSGTAAYTTLTVGKLTGTTNLKIDVDLSGTTAQSDSIKVNSDSAGAAVNLTSINVRKDVAVDSAKIPETYENAITYVTGTPAGIDYSLDQDLEIVSTNNYIYIFALGDAGKLNYTVKAAEVTFKKFIEGGLEGTPGTLSLTADMVDDNADMGLNTKDALTINLNGHTLGSSAGANTVAIGTKTMNLDGGETAGTVYTSWTTAEGGELNISGLTKMEGTITGSGTLSNSGTLTISADNLGVAASNSGTISLTGGELAHAITGGTLKVTGDVTANANYIQSNTNTIAEGKVLTLTGGELSKDLTGDIKNTGTLTVTGTVTGNIDNDSTLNLNSTYTSTTAIDNDGTLNVTATNLKADVTNTKGTVNLGAGELTKVITEGTLNITQDAAVTTSADNLKETTVINNGSIALTGGSLTVALAGTLSNSGELTTAAGNLDAALTNTGTVNLTTGTLEKAINGGTTNIAGTVTVSANVGNVTVAEAGTLTADISKLTGTITNGGTFNMSGDLSKDIAGAGTTVLQNAITVTEARNVEGTLNVNGKTIDMQEAAGVEAAYTTLTVGKLAGTTNLKIDVDLSGATAQSDSLKVNSDSMGSALNLTSINVRKDVAVDPAEIPENYENAVTYVTGIPEGIYYSLDEALEIVSTNNYIYTFACGDAGKLSYTVSAAEVTFQKFIEGALEGTPGTLSLTADMADDAADMGLNTKDALTINLNGHTLGSSAEANTVAIGTKTMNLNGGETEGTVYTRWDVAEGGTLNTSGLVKLEGVVTGAGTLTNSGTLTIDADNLGVATTNSGTISLGDGTLNCVVTGGKVEISGTVAAAGNNLVNTAVTATSGGELIMTGGTYAGSLAVDAGVISLALDDYSAITSLSVKNSGGINITNGTHTDDSTVAKLTEGKLTLDGTAIYSTTAGKVFAEADATEEQTGGFSSNNKFNYVSGTLELTDAYYSIDYLNDAIKTLNSDTKVKMTGTLKEETITTEQASKLGENVELPTATVVVPKEKKNTIIGTDTEEDVSVSGVGTITDKHVEGFNINKLDLSAGSTGMVITNDKKVVLGGNGDTEQGNLVTVDGKDEKVNVIVGTKENVAGAENTAGTLGIGIEGSINDKGYKLNADVTVNEGSKVEVNGDTEITGKVTLSKAVLETAEGKTTKVAQDLEVSNASTILGNTEVAGSLVGGDDAVIQVGNENGKGILSVKSIKMTSRRSKGVVFADPAWKNEGENDIDDASKVATASVDLDASYIAGQNSIITFGTESIDEGVNAFKESGLLWGNGKDMITAAIYVHDNVSLVHEEGAYEYVGDIMADGSREANPGPQTNSRVNFAANSLLMVNGNICLNEPSNAAIQKVEIIKYTTAYDSAGEETASEDGVADTSKLFIRNAVVGDYYILSGETALVGSTMTTDLLWDSDSIILSDILEVDKIDVITDATNSYFRVTTKSKEGEDIPAYIDKSVAPAAYRAVLADENSEAFTHLSVVGEIPSEATKIALLNQNANMPEELGVMHNHFNVTNISADAVAKHLALDEHTNGREVWAQAIHSKENVSGLGLASQGNSYDTQYNGTVVGIDLMDNGKTTLGAALTYIDGKATNAGSHNEGKYYGATLYGRTKIGKDAGVQYDISYTHSKNELDMYSGCSYGQITGDQKVNSFSLGARFEKELRVGKSSSFVPHIGARWLRMKAGSFTNSLGNTYNPDATNSLIVPLGLSFKAGMQNSGWKMSFLADLGYQWNTGDRDYRQHFSYNGAGNSFDVAFADSNSWYAGMGFEFAKKNFTAGVGYRYAKGESTRQNKWSVNMSWAF